MLQNRKKKFAGFLFTTVFYSAVAGALCGTVITLFKYFAAKAVHASEVTYTFLRENPIWITAAVGAIVLLALGYVLLYRFVPDARGGGIPTSVGIIRGALSFKWLRNLVSVFVASLVTFFTGMPLGTEGPSVQIGTALGKGVASISKKHGALDRYVMTGSASAGFAVATGAPIAGIMFALEEVHQRISPMILIAASFAVIAAKTVSDLLSPLMGVSTGFFEELELPALAPNDFWIPALVAITAGLLSVAFLKYYKVLHKLWTKRLAKLPILAKIITVLAFTLILGLVADSFVSTGHHLADSLLHTAMPIYMLFLAFIIRTTLMVLASSSGITGGLFLPILALGALGSALVGNILVLLGMNPDFYPVIVMLGITSSIAGMMKMPVTAIAFAIEGLSLSNNILPVIITALVVYLVTELFTVKSITESVLENRVHSLHNGKEPTVCDAFVKVGESSFAEGKQVRDVLWPNNTFVLSIRRANTGNAVVDELSETVILAGDTVHLRYSTYDTEAIRTEICALLGEQEYCEEPISKI